MGRRSNIEITQDALTNLDRVHDFKAKGQGRSSTKFGLITRNIMRHKPLFRTNQNNLTRLGIHIKMSPFNASRRQLLLKEMLTRLRRIPSEMTFMHRGMHCQTGSHNNSEIVPRMVFKSLDTLENKYLLSIDAVKQGVSNSKTTRKLLYRTVNNNRQKMISENTFITPATIFDSAVTDMEYITLSNYIYIKNTVNKSQQEIKTLFDSTDVFAKTVHDNYYCHLQYTHTIRGEYNSIYKFYAFIEKTTGLANKSFFLLYRSDLISKNNSVNLQKYKNDMLCKRVIQTCSECTLNLSNIYYPVYPKDIQFIKSTKERRTLIYNSKKQSLFVRKDNKGPSISELKILYVKKIQTISEKLTGRKQFREYKIDQFEMISNVKVLGDLGQLLTIKKLQEQNNNTALILATQDQIMAYTAVNIYKINTVFNSGGCYTPILHKTLLPPPLVRNGATTTRQTAHNMILNLQRVTWNDLDKLDNTNFATFKLILSKMKT